MYLKLNWWDSVGTGGKKHAAGTDNAERLQFSLNVDAFINENEQFMSNLDEYHYVKINYFAVTFSELGYFGFQIPAKYDGQFTSVGITAMQTNNYPMYFVWDIEDDLGFGTGAGLVDIQGLTQYMLTKKLRPTSRKPVSFVYRVPVPWRQFYSCYSVKGTMNRSIGDFFSNLSGIKNLRYPKKMYGGHQDWWSGSFTSTTHTAQIDSYSPGYTGVACKFYMGVTFRGRRIMGGATKALELTP